MYGYRESKAKIVFTFMFSTKCREIRKAKSLPTFWFSTKC